MNREFLQKHPKAKKSFKIMGLIFLPVGIFCIITAFIDFFVAISSGKAPNLFFLFFIGFPFIFVGIVTLSLGFMKEINSYVASESAPVSKDVANYMLDGTREETINTVSDVASTIKGETINKEIICPSCGTKNEKGAQFCDHCGKSLIKKCRCGEINDIDSIYCRKCGNKL